MKKLYWDIALGIIALIFVIKYTKFVLLFAIVGIAIWIFAINDNKKQKIKEKVSNLYNR